MNEPSIEVKTKKPQISVANAFPVMSVLTFKPVIDYRLGGFDDNYLLQETGFLLLLEDGFKIRL